MSDDPFKSNSRNTMLLYAKKIKDIREFVRWVQFDTNSKESLAEKIFVEENKNLQANLEKKIKEMRNFDHTENIALGCRARCFFSGARSMNNGTCEDNKKYKTPYHRPMAFHGTHWLKNGKKVLIDDVCSSQANLTDGRWPMPTTNAAG